MDPNAAAADPLLDRAIWLACAGPLALLPSIGDKVYYFARGHADQCRGVPLPPGLPLHDDPKRCTVDTIELHYRDGTGEPYAVIGLSPDPTLQLLPPAAQIHELTAMRYYVKLLEGTTDDVAPFSVPGPCIQAMFPHLEGDGDLRQELEFTDVNGHPNYTMALFRRGSTHKLSKGWNKFCQDKHFKLGDDSVVFIRPSVDEDRVLIGSRRGSGPSMEIAMELLHDVQQAAPIAAAGEDPFTVTYYPRQGWAFVVPRKEADEGLAVHWEIGMDIRLPITSDAHELEASRLADRTPAFFQGVVTAVNNNAHWAKLQVDWAESPTPPPENNVNAWQVEAVEAVEAEE